MAYGTAESKVVAQTFQSDLAGFLVWDSLSGRRRRSD
jgi:hypothetical protein